jgi:hypothetical protein
MTQPTASPWTASSTLADRIATDSRKPATSPRDLFIAAREAEGMTYTQASFAWAARPERVASLNQNDWRGRGSLPKSAYGYDNR